MGKKVRKQTGLWWEINTCLVQLAYKEIQGLSNFLKAIRLIIYKDDPADAYNKKNVSI